MFFLLTPECFQLFPTASPAAATENPAVRVFDPLLSELNLLSAGINPVFAELNLLSAGINLLVAEFDLLSFIINPLPVEANPFIRVINLLSGLMYLLFFSISTPPLSVKPPSPAEPLLQLPLLFRQSQHPVKHRLFRVMSLPAGHIFRSYHF